jgi:HEAT repeat protein
VTLPAPVLALREPSSTEWREVLGEIERALSAEAAGAALRPADEAPGEAVQDTAPIAVGESAGRLLLLARGGTLIERREAVRRLGDVLAGHVNAEDVGRREIAASLDRAWDPDIAYELTHSLRHASGAMADDALETLNRTQDLMTDLLGAIERYWDAADPVDPILALSPEERTLVGVFCRDMPDLPASHLSELLVQLLRMGATAPLREATFALIPAGDARILPALVRLLEDGEQSVRLAAARALGRVDDPRAPAALARALEREQGAEARTVLGGSLALAGDPSAAPEIRTALGSSESVLVEVALESLATAGGVQDVRAICERLDPSAPGLAVAAAWALARVGTASALPPLETALARAELPAVRIALAEAAETVRARCALAGEAAIPAQHEPSAHASAIRALALRGAPELPAKVSLWSRARSRVRDYWGRTLFAFGLDRAASRSFARASALNPRAILASLREGRSRMRHGEHEEALAAFRRALGRDRTAASSRREELADLVRVYLRESTRLEDASDRTQARQTLDELLALDLALVPLPLRLELARRREVLRRT